MNKEVLLASGAKLQMTMASFPEGKALYQALLEEIRGIKLEANSDLQNVDLWKNIFCAGFSSKKIELALSKCLERCLYDGKKITDQLFEDATIREDYIDVCAEVTLFNVAPFTKSLLRRLLQARENVETVQL